jgi:hypothetical protein
MKYRTLAAGIAVLPVAGVIGSIGSAAARQPTAVRDCSPEEAQQVVAHFTRAFNVGKIARLDNLFAKDDHDGDVATPSFQWYSTGPPGARFGRAAEKRSTLMRYFRKRHRQGERLYLLWMSRGGNDGDGYFSFGFHVRRQARGLRPTAFEGKGAVICSNSAAQIAVWSVGPRLADAP